MTAESIERRARRQDVVPQEEPDADRDVAEITEDAENTGRGVADDNTGGVWEPGR